MREIRRLGETDQAEKKKGRNEHKASNMQTVPKTSTHCEFIMWSFFPKLFDLDTRTEPPADRSSPLTAREPFLTLLCSDDLTLSRRLWNRQNNEKQ